MLMESRDPHRLLAGLAGDGVSLELATLDLCFLAALYLRAEQDGLASFEEDVVLVFDQVCSLVDPGVESEGSFMPGDIRRDVSTNGAICAAAILNGRRVSLIDRLFLRR